MSIHILRKHSSVRFLEPNIIIVLHKFCHNLKDTHTNTSYGDVTGYVLGTSRNF
jgi:hypothetical protein